MKEKQVEFNLKNHLITIAVMFVGMTVFVRLSLTDVKALSVVFRGAGYLCAIIGAASVYACVMQLFAKKK